MLLLAIGIAVCCFVLLYSTVGQGFEVIALAALSMIPTHIGSFIAYNHPDTAVSARLVRLYRIALYLQVSLVLVILYNYMQANSISVY